MQLNLINDKSARDIGDGWGTREDKIKKIMSKGFNKSEFIPGFSKKCKILKKALKQRFKLFLFVNGEMS